MLPSQVRHYAPGPHLWDVRNASLAELTRGEFRRITLALPGFEGSGPKEALAILTSRDVDYGVARMFEMTEGPLLDTLVRVFRDAVAAERWLERCRTD